MNYLPLFQRRAVNCLKGVIQKHGGAYLHGDMGIGKTIISAHLFEERTLWVGPAKDLKGIRKKLDEYEELYGLKVNPTMISYNKFGKYTARELRDYDMVVFDEAHQLRNYTASWTKTFVKSVRFQKMLFLSGTPYLKGKMDIIYPLRKLGVFSNFRTLKAAKQYFFNWEPVPGNTEAVVWGDLKREEDFDYLVDQVSYRIKKTDIDKDIPPPVYNLVTVPGEIDVAENIQQMTQTDVKNGLNKVDFVADYIKKDKKKHGFSKCLILCRFHEVANAIGEKLESAPILENTDKINDSLKGYVVSTLGLTSSNLDFNSCNHVYMVEYSYSVPLNQQSIERCLRKGKRATLHVTYFGYETDNNLEKAVGRAKLLDKGVYRNNNFRPSGYKRLENCPGSHWFPERPIDWVDKYSYFGTMAHAAVERYVNNPDIKLPVFLCPNVAAAVRECRRLLKDSDCYGVEASVSVPSIDPKVAGTVDFWAYKNDTLYVCDYKNGSTLISPKNNLQLQTYALAICETVEIEPDKICVGILQKGQFKKDVFSYSKLEEIRARVSNIIDKVKAAKDNPKAHLNENKCCGFCPAEGHHSYENGGEDMNAKRDVFEVEGEIFWSTSEVGKNGVHQTGLGINVDRFPSAKIKAKFPDTEVVANIKKKLLEPREDEKGEIQDERKVLFLWNQTDYAKKAAKKVPSISEDNKKCIVYFNINVTQDNKVFLNLKDFDLVEGDEEL